MFNMSNLPIAFQSTEKSQTFPCKHISLDSLARNALDMLCRQNWVGKLIVLLSLLFLTAITITMQSQIKFCVCFTKINTKLFFCRNKAFIDTKKFALHLTLKKVFL